MRARVAGTHADLPSPPPPPLHPKTLQPITAEDLAPLFPQGLIAQEVSTERCEQNGVPASGDDARAAAWTHARPRRKQRSFARPARCMQRAAIPSHPVRYIDIPPEVLEVYKLWRPSPLFRARRLEKALGTPARIYYK